MEQVTPRVLALALQGVVKLVATLVLFVFFSLIFTGLPLLLAPVYVDVAASFGYKTTEAVGIASLLGCGIAGALTGMVMQSR